MLKKRTANIDKFRRCHLFLALIFSLIINVISTAYDTIDTSQSIRDGDTLVSPSGMFELGFFSPRNYTNQQYVGIWYKNITFQTVVWVANRQAPLTTRTGVLRITEPGILTLLNDTNGTILWSTNVSRTARNPSAQLLDTGNLVLRDANNDRSGNFLWQSFDHPSDTYLPGMLSLGWDLTTPTETYLSSWRSDDDPTPGEFTAHLDPTGYPQFFIKQGGAIRSRVGPWNGARFSWTTGGSGFDQVLVMNTNEVRYGEDFSDPTVVSRVTLSARGVVLRRTWNDSTGWTIYWNTPADQCDLYNWCSAHGICEMENSQRCGCLDRFVPRDPDSWAAEVWRDGCVRRVQLNCNDDVFLTYSGIKLPDSRNSTFEDRVTSMEECEARCRRNCDCIAYARLNISGSGSGCLFYHGELLDMRTVPRGGRDLYIRMAFAERAEDSEGNSRLVLVASLTSVAVAFLLCLILIFIYARKRKARKEAVNGSHYEEAELPFFGLSTILKATNNFSNDNKLGQGGFGSVYRGMLGDGREIAVKCLSKTSTQGVEELKNEVILIAKLQHRNLVRLLGCCIQRDENMLIYEYMPNSSLDLILFDHTRSSLLDWKKRFHIINGIAKGLLYLHEDSRLRIIHRDLKASNVLLDADMNPKISDFGLARSFGGNQIEAQTQRVVGTYGYMSPEYAMDGLFSIKSDVFSFGVLVLEIVSGKRNRGFTLNDHDHNLIEHAWTLYNESNLSTLVDASMGDSIDLTQVLHSIHVGLLCVQKRREDRPNMSSVVFMLGNEVDLPPVKQPGVFTETDVFAAQSSSSAHARNSMNQVTITMLQGR